MDELAPGQLRVIPLGVSQLRAVAILHRDVLPPSLFSRLGQRFLRQYLDTFRTSPHATALVAVQDEQVLGFLVGIVSPPAHGRWVLRAAGAKLGLLGLVGLLGRPVLLAHFLRTRLGRYVRGLTRRLGRTGGVEHDTAVGVPAVLAHVAVSPHAQGRGVGQALVQGFADDVRAGGRSVIELVTRAGSDAEAFYQRLGYERIGERVDDDHIAWASYRHCLV